MTKVDDVYNTFQSWDPLGCWNVFFEYIKMPANLEHVENTIITKLFEFIVPFFTNSSMKMGLKNQGLQKWDSK